MKKQATSANSSGSSQTPPNQTPPKASVKNSETVFLQSFQNHLQVFYDQEKFAFRPKAESIWKIQIGSSLRPTGDWRVELEAAAHQIWQLATQKKEIVLYVDGSYTSQVMASAFYWARVPFRAVIPRFEKDMNLAAIAQAVMLLDEYGASYELQDLDLNKFLSEGEAKEWSKKYSTDRVDQLVAMKVWKLQNVPTKFFVFPFGLVTIAHIVDGWKVLECERDYGTLLFQKDTKYAGSAGFFKWSPEVIASFLQDPRIKAIVTNQLAVPGMTDSVLKDIFQNYFKVFGNKNLNGLEQGEFLVKRFLRDLEKNSYMKTSAFSINFADFLMKIQFQPKSPERAKPAEGSA